VAPPFSVHRYRHLNTVVHACQWLTMREQFGLAPNTLDAYARAIDSYCFFLESREHTWETSTQGDVAGWINELRTRGLANATLIQRVTAVRLFFEYLVEEGLRPGNPVSRGGTFRGYGSAVFRTAGLVRRLHRLPWIPTDEEWERVLHVTAEDCIRDRAMLALAYDGALRREELCSIAVSDFDFARKLLTVRAERRRTVAARSCHTHRRPRSCCADISTAATRCGEIRMQYSFQSLRGIELRRLRLTHGPRRYNASHCEAICRS